MTYENKLIVGITVPVGLLFLMAIVLIIYLYERKYHPMVKAEKNVIEEPQVEYIKARVLEKRVHVYYTSQINIPKSVMEFWVMFAMEDRTQKEYSLSQELFEKIEEGQEGTLVLLNGMFFDFGEGEDIDSMEQ